MSFVYLQDDPLISRIKKDCERKEEFLKTQTYPAYLSSPPKDIDSSPYGIASLANTMPPPRTEPPPQGDSLLLFLPKNAYEDFWTPKKVTTSIF